MYQVGLYRQVRQAHALKGMSIREISRVFGLHRDTIRKMLRYSVPQGYQRSKPPRKPKLSPFIGIIDSYLENDKNKPKKQRHTAKRIFDRLKDEHGYSGGYTIVKDYVREKHLRTREMFVPLSHPPGHGQADFGEALFFIGGVELKGHYFCVDLPHSDDLFVKVYPAETMEAFCDGHNSAFSYFGGVPRSMLYDNTKLAVGRIEDDGTRRYTQKFDELLSHYLFDARFGRPGKGNDKGKVFAVIYSFLFLGSTALIRSTDGLRRSAVNAVIASFAATRRPLASASKLISKSSCPYRLFPMMPVTRLIPG